MSAKKKVLIAEDHQMLREGLKAILNGREDLEVVGEAADGLEAIRSAKKLKPDLVLLDLSMPRMNGLSVLREVKSDNPNTKILVLTIHESEKRVIETFQAGANGYASKSGSREELLLAIDSILDDRIFISPVIGKQVMEDLLTNKVNNETDPAWEAVTHREKEILKLLAEGFTNREIADMLYISVKTVEKHRANLMSKLDLHNVPRLTALAIEKGLVERKD